MNARNIPLENIFFFNNTSTPTKETINRDQFNTYFANPFLEMLFNRTSTTELNYLVSTKGIPYESVVEKIRRVLIKNFLYSEGHMPPV